VHVTVHSKVASARYGALIQQIMIVGDVFQRI